MKFVYVKWNFSKNSKQQQTRQKNRDSAKPCWSDSRLGGDTTIRDRSIFVDRFCISGVFGLNTESPKCVLAERTWLHALLELFGPSERWRGKE